MTLAYFYTEKMTLKWKLLKKEIESVLKNIEKIENSLKYLDAKFGDIESIIDRLESIQSKFERFTKLEKQIFDQETVINNLVKRVNDMENNLSNKNVIINDLAEKLKDGKEFCLENDTHTFENEKRNETNAQSY